MESDSIIHDNSGREYNDNDAVLTCGKLNRLKAMIGDRNPQEAYVKNKQVKALADEILGDHWETAKAEVATYLGGHKQVERRWSRDALLSVANVGDIGGVFISGDKRAKERKTYGGLLGAILRADPASNEPRQIMQYFHTKAQCAIQDFVRREGQFRRKHTDKKRAQGERYDGALKAFRRFDDNVFLAYHADFLNVADGIPVGEDERGKLKQLLGSSAPPSSRSAEENSLLDTFRLHYVQQAEEKILPIIVERRNDIRNAHNYQEMAQKVYLYLKTVGFSDDTIAKMHNYTPTAITKLRGDSRLPNPFAFSVFGICDRHLPQGAFADRYRGKTTGETPAEKGWVDSTRRSQTGAVQISG